MFIVRSIQPKIFKVLDQGLVTIVYGARQVGKTTLAKQVAKSYKNSIYLNCDDPIVVSSLTEKSALELKSYIGNPDLVIIDEAQRVNNIGLTLKLLHDSYPEIPILVTGSSSLDLANKVTEPLTGRSVEIILYPLSVNEVSKSNAEIQTNSNILLNRGGYPGMWKLPSHEAHERLSNIANNYVYRDAFSPNVIYDQTIINNLLRFLAYQIGHEVNYSELATKLSISKDTVQRYVDLLEKAFIIFRRNQYRRNQRAEIGRLRKVFFYDLGIRNAIVDNFKPANLRDDMGALWENFCIIERLKYLQTTNKRVSSFYWRNADGREIDMIEEENDSLRAYECKFSNKKVTKIPVAYERAYPNSSYDTVNPSTFADKLL